jgi:2-amino-1-hydroxyethylphosphonate dioxygenase (glycine-forming)
MTRKQMLDKQRIDDVFALFDLYGAEDYIGEPVSQLEHASQAAQLAENEGYDEEVILAALLHDIGHLCAHTHHYERMEGFGVKSHEQIGADYLRRHGLPERIAQLVENHVRAKRYLTFKYPEYYHNLSEASKKTLEFQGGKMTENEAIAFESEELFATSIKMRTWDEKAKETNMPLPDMNKYKEMALRLFGNKF